MPTKTEAARRHDLIIYELDDRFTRDRITLYNPSASVAASYVVGDVLIDNGDDTFQQVANADSPASGGAILAENVDDLASETGIEVWAWVRGPLILDKSGLDYADASGADILVIDAELLAAGIKLVDGSPMTETME